LFADELVGCKICGGLQPSHEAVGAAKVGEVIWQLIMAVLVEAFERRFLDRSVHPFDRAIFHFKEKIALSKTVVIHLSSFCETSKKEMNLDATNWVGAISARPKEVLYSYRSDIGIIGGCIGGKFWQRGAILTKLEQSRLMRAIVACPTGS
jgi:hypothetical protein